MLPAGVLGVVHHLEGPNGPGRITSDEGDFLFFDAGVFQGPSLRKQARVIAQGVRRKKGKRPAWMFDGTLEASVVVPYPPVKWSAFKPKPGPSASVVRQLLMLGGAQVQKGAAAQATAKGAHSYAPGDLVFAYGNGVHRFLALKGGMLITEQVLSSKLKRVRSRWSAQVSKWVSPVPLRFERAVASAFAL